MRTKEPGLTLRNVYFDKKPRVIIVKKKARVVIKAGGWYRGLAYVEKGWVGDRLYLLCLPHNEIYYE